MNNIILLSDMETHAIPPPYVLPNGAHPSSPPMTPGTRSHAHFLPGTGHPPPVYKRMDAAMLAQSPPLDFVEPIVKDPHFSLPPRQPSLSSQSSTAGHACASDASDESDSDDTDPENTDSEDIESDEEIVKPVPRPPRKVDHAQFVLEDLGSDPGYDSELEVVQPDHYEEARSDQGEARPDDDGLLNQFNELRCSAGSSDEEEQQRLYRRKKKRWSAGIFKRSHSQSVEGDSSYSDNDPLDDVDYSARRLRRRVRGPGDRTSLIFEDKGFSNANNIAEVEEPKDGESIPHTKGPPSIPSDDGFALDELPFWFVGDLMDVEFESS